MNQLFVRVVLICSVVICIWYFIIISKWSKKIILVPAKTVPPKVAGILVPSETTPPDEARRLVVYGSTKNLNNLTDIETQLYVCNQQTGLIEVEINNLQTLLTEKKQQSFSSCQQKLKNRLSFYKKLYKSIYNVDMSNKELTELENKIGIETKIEL
jgi:hypothetical protein